MKCVRSVIGACIRRETFKMDQNPLTLNVMEKLVFMLQLIAVQ